MTAVSRLQDELDRAHRIFDSIGNGVSLCDATHPEMPLVYVNRAFQRMTGYSAEECCGRNCRFLQGRQTDQPGLTKVREAIRDRHDVRVLLKNQRKDGSQFWNELYLSPLFDRAGALTHFMGIQNDVTVQVESRMQLNHLAHHDALTGLANRDLLLEQLQQAIGRARRAGARVGVLYFDIDNFKQVNHAFGHQAGDELLQLVAQRLKSGMRTGETVARLGGDEFVAVLEQGSAREWRPAAAMQRLTAHIAGPISLSDTRYHPSTTVGIGVYPQDGDSPESLLKVAEFKMYLAKQERQTKPKKRAPHRLDLASNALR